MSYINNNGKIGYEELSPEIVNILKECSKPVILKKYKKVINVTSSSSAVSLGFQLDTDELLLVFKNSVLLDEGTDYNLNEERNAIGSLKGNWVGTADSPVHFSIVVVGVTRLDPARQK